MSKNQSAWSHPIVKGMVGVAAFVIVAEILVIYIPDAWAATTIPITDRYVIQLGELPQWIISFVAAAGLWKAWRAEKESLKNSAIIGKVQDDVKLIERNTNSISTRNEAIARKLGIEEGIQQGKLQGVADAATLAEGHRQGIEQERASVAAAGKAAPSDAPLAPDGKPPLPVADDRTAGAAERVAEATERVAAATEGSQPQVKRE